MITSCMRKYVYSELGKQISLFAKYYDSITQVNKLPWDDCILFDSLESRNKNQATLHELVKSRHPGERSIFLLSGNINLSFNIQEFLEELHGYCTATTKVVCIVYNSYLSFVFRAANFLRLRKGPIPKSFITQVDLDNIVNLSGYEICYQSNMILFPFKLFGLGSWINRFLKIIPIINKLSLFSLVVLRPILQPEEKSISIIIPARNEEGNIKNAVSRLPDLNADVEIIFVEGNSSDNTWKEIKKIVSDQTFNQKYRIKAYRQPGKGKYDAVKVGFHNAENDILVILDADLTMPPELLPQFINAYRQGKGEFINGSRLVYPMEGEAMRFLNLLGNKFFAKLLSFLLGTKLGDTLCGTKIVSRTDYDRICKWRHDFGDFDPFGDFELLFSASVLKLRIVDIPVMYRARTYGSPQISRFRDGFTLLKMSFIALVKITLKRM